MRILALDLATKTGWAFWDGVRIESGVQDFSKQRGESNGMLFLKFNHWLDGQLALNQDVPNAAVFDLIVFEQAHHRGGAATEICVGLMTRVLEFCARYGIEHAAVHSATLKKWATGSGRADKMAMIRRAIQLRAIAGWPDWQSKDDNEADAVLLLSYALKNFGGASPWNARSASPEARSSKQENITP